VCSKSKSWPSYGGRIHYAIPTTWQIQQHEMRISRKGRMSFLFRPALRENVGLLMGLIGPSGGGKTFSAMRLAAGIAGERRFAVIDTEAGERSTTPTAFSSTTAT
jgi:hypothetical protein